MPALSAARVAAHTRHAKNHAQERIASCTGRKQPGFLIACAPPAVDRCWRSPPTVGALPRPGLARAKHTCACRDCSHEQHAQSPHACAELWVRCLPRHAPFPPPPSPTPNPQHDSPRTLTHLHSTLAVPALPLSLTLSDTHTRSHTPSLSHTHSLTAQPDLFRAQPSRTSSDSSLGDTGPASGLGAQSSVV